MGFFSWDCKECGHPALCSMATDDDGLNDWMSKIVVLKPNGTILVGEYDGYGRVDGMEFNDLIDADIEIWHHACWVKAGKPDFSGPSDRSLDQGWFFNDGKHSMPEPIPAE